MKAAMKPLDKQVVKNRDDLSKHPVSKLGPYSKSCSFLMGSITWEQSF